MHPSPLQKAIQHLQTAIDDANEGFYRLAITQLRDALPLLRTLADQADLDANIQASIRAEIDREESSNG